VPAWLSHISEARMALAPGLIAMVARAKEDS
jgi:hypothetical protein